MVTTPERLAAAASTRAVHTADSSDWYTPRWIAKGAYVTFDRRPDMDPASCAIANKVIGALEYLTEDGLNLMRYPQADDACMFKNPPSPPAEWWKASVDWCSRGLYRSTLYVGYSIEQMQQTQGWTPVTPIQFFPHCVPKKRVTFLCTAFQARLKIGKRLDKRETFREVQVSQAEVELEANGESSPSLIELNAQIEVSDRAIATLSRKLQELAALPDDELVDGDQPTHASVIALIHNPRSAQQDIVRERIDRFAEYFEAHGAVVVP